MGPVKKEKGLNTNIKDTSCDFENIYTAKDSNIFRKKKSFCIKNVFMSNFKSYNNIFILHILQPTIKAKT